MAYSADYALATSSAFMQQVQMAMVKAAVAIAAEAYTSKGQFLKRQSLANKVLLNPSAYVQYFAMATVEAGGLSGSPADAQVDTQITATWNGLAGVTAADTV